MFTDFWRGYNGLRDFFDHRIVNKSKLGCGTSEYMSTNRVEALWANIKRRIYPYNSLNKKRLQLFLDEALWRRKYVRLFHSL